MFDCHVHTKFSTDSKMEILDVIERIKKINMGVILTEHMDLNYPIPGEFVFNPDEYFNEYIKYRSDNLLLGVELGLDTDFVDKNKQFTQDYEFDYVIGSIHVIDKLDLYYETIYKGKSKNQVYEQYFKYMFDCIKDNDFIDSLGHIDYIARYARYSDAEIYYSEFGDFIDEILKALAQGGKSLELSLRRFDNRDAVKNMIPIYKRFHELGGKLVTLGSDAHATEDIGRNFGIAKEIVDSCNLKTVYFKERKPYYL